MDKKKYQDSGAVKRGNNAARRREKERMKDVKAGSTAPTESLRPKMRPKPGQMSGKNFRGTF